MTVVSLVPNAKPDLAAEALKTLNECIEMAPQGVIVFAWIDGKIHTKHSGYYDRLTIMGALEAAKLETWNL